MPRTFCKKMIHHQFTQSLICLVEEQEGWKPDTSSLFTSNISPCLGVVRVVSLLWIKMRDCWVSLQNVAMKLISKHPKGDIVAKLFNLVLNVTEKGIAWSSPDHHDGVEGAFAKLHCHGCTRSNQVSAYLTFLYPNFVISHCSDSTFKCFCHWFWGDVIDSTMMPHHWSRGFCHQFLSKSWFALLLLPIDGPDMEWGCPMPFEWLCPFAHLSYAIPKWLKHSQHILNFCQDVSTLFPFWRNRCFSIAAHWFAVSLPAELSGICTSNMQHAKKNALIASWLVAHSSLVVCCFAILQRTPIGRAFCWWIVGILRQWNFGIVMGNSSSGVIEAKVMGYRYVGSLDSWNCQDNGMLGLPSAIIRVELSKWSPWALYFWSMDSWIYRCNGIFEGRQRSGKADKWQTCRMHTKKPLFAN